MKKPDQFEAELSKLEPQVRKAFLDAIAQIKSAAQFQVVIGHIQAGRIEQAVTALRLDAEFFDPVARAVQEAFVRGGVTALAKLPTIPDPFLVMRVLLLASTADDHALKNGSGDDLEI